MRTVTRLLTLILLLPVICHSQELLTRQLTLSEMTEQSGSIVRGTVVVVALEPHPDFPNISTLRVTLQVSDSIYGTAGPQSSFRIYLSAGKFAQRAVKPARADYRVGDEVLLFLYPNSRYGLTSPVGGEQGRFRVIREGERSLVINPLGNRGLFEGVETRAQAQGIPLTTRQRALVRQSAGSAELQSFVDIVRQLAAGKKSQ